MSFFAHIEELRTVLISCMVTLLVLAVGGWFASEWAMNFLISWAGLEGVQFIRPQEAFFTRFKISLLLGFIAGLPFIAFWIWGFVVPGLLRRERRVVLPLVFWSTLLFLIGIAFAILILTPVMLKFLIGFQTSLVEANLAVGYVVDFYVRMCLACGILFQLPLVVAILSFFGIITPGFLKSMWRHAIVVILIAAAIVTPADMLSQLVLGLPIILLYFISILISSAIHRGRQREAAKYDEEPPEPDDVPPHGPGEEPPLGPEDAHPRGPDGAQADVQDDAPPREADGASDSGSVPEAPAPPGRSADTPPQEGPAEPEAAEERKGEESGPPPLHPPEDWSI